MSDTVPPNLSAETAASNAGGVAARQGFKYQDHVAAFFVLAMIADPRLQRVECETADDILLIWKDGAAEFPEYVQVKTTENDKKWSQAEITQRAVPKSKNPTSLIEKSLLCDKEAAGALFRIVSKRDVNRTLMCLKLDRDNRQRASAAFELSKKLAKKWTTKSQNGNDLAYWTKAVFWHVGGEIESIQARNRQYLAGLADRHGANPTHAHADRIYDDLLAKVDAAAVASKVTAADKKIITREQALEWWSIHLQETEAARQKTSKPYRVHGDVFFAELHQLSEADVRRALASYDARFEQKKWRSLQLANYLVDWLPEIALKASDLVPGIRAE
jgi:Cap4 dsDNA endonuclease